MNQPDTGPGPQAPQGPGPRAYELGTILIAALLAALAHRGVASPPPDHTMSPSEAPAALWLLDTLPALEGALVPGPRPLLLAVGASWCPPCRALRPVLGGLARERVATLAVASVDVDRLADVVERLDISSVPTLVLLQDGVERGRHRGGATRIELERWLDGLLTAPPP